jgi:hypothetical protein
MSDQKNNIILTESIEQRRNEFDESANNLVSKMNDLVERSKLLLLTREEQDMLAYFKKFKNSIKRPDLFTWQTCPFTDEEREVMDKRMTDLIANDK